MGKIKTKIKDSDPVSVAQALVKNAWNDIQAVELKYNRLLHKKICMNAAWWNAKAILLVARANAAGFTDNLLQAHLTAAKVNLKRCKTGRGWAETKLDGQVIRWIKSDAKTVENCYEEVNKMFYLWQEKQKAA